jgi:hypothetical protein
MTGRIECFTGIAKAIGGRDLKKVPMMIDCRWLGLIDESRDEFN